MRILHLKGISHFTGIFHIKIQKCTSLVGRWTLEITCTLSPIFGLWYRSISKGAPHQASFVVPQSWQRCQFQSSGLGRQPTNTLSSPTSPSTGRPWLLRWNPFYPSNGFLIFGLKWTLLYLCWIKGLEMLLNEENVTPAMTQLCIPWPSV